MKKTIILGLLIFASCVREKRTFNEVAELSCGQCKFGLKSKSGCDLAVRFGDKAYFVEGFNIDEFGDAHDKTTGFCEVIRKGTVIGVLENDTFVANSISMID
ncbi:MAG: DUF6370 family protein [Polaribacter sp.]|jgi:hypothetical protein